MPDEGKKGETKDQPGAEIDIKALFSSDDKSEAVSTEKKDEKEPASSAVTVEEDPKKLQAKVDGLTQELARVRKSKAESSSEVQELREQLSNMQGQLEVLTKQGNKSESGESPLAKYTDEQLLQGQTEWEDEIIEAKDALRRARAENDETLYAKATKALSTAKNTLTSIRKELMERTKRVGVEQAKANTETQELVQEISGIYEAAYEAFPDLKDKDSDLWKAGNKAYNEHPKLMKQLGPLAEIVAMSMALTENPKLSPKEGDKSEKKARKELLEEINERAEESLIKGKGTTSKKVATDFAAMPKGQFDNLIHRLKMGG